MKDLIHSKEKQFQLRLKEKIDNKIVFSETSELIVDEDTFHARKTKIFVCVTTRNQTLEEFLIECEYIH